MEKSFQQYIDEKYNIKNLGPYDYTRFCSKMREPIFKNNLYDTYIKSIAQPLSPVTPPPSRSLK